jgi:hypothetical protein
MRCDSSHSRRSSRDSTPDGGLLHELWICLDAAIATSGRGESRPGESRPGESHETIEADQRLRRDAENAFRDCEVVREIEVVDAVRYRASPSFEGFPRSEVARDERGRGCSSHRPALRLLLEALRLLEVEGDHQSRAQARN